MILIGLSFKDGLIYEFMLPYCITPLFITKNIKINDMDIDLSFLIF